MKIKGAFSIHISFTSTTTTISLSWIKHSGWEVSYLKIKVSAFYKQVVYFSNVVVLKFS